MNRRAETTAPATISPTLMTRLAAYWHWPIWAAVAILLVIGAVDLATPVPDRAARLRAVYAGSPDHWPAPWVDPDVAYVELAAADLPPRPEAGSAEARKVALGERLFNDPILSASGHIACQSCHNRRLGWGDGLPRAFGHGRAEGTRNAPSLFAAWARPAFFWDGRAASLEDQVMGPLAAENEMANHDLSDVAHRLKWLPGYPEAFAAVYGDSEITLARVAGALASFERQLDFPSRLDRFLSGETAMLSDRQIEGLHLFRTKARCVNCHMGPALMDGQAHKIGLTYYQRRYEDMGRYALTGDPADAGAFLTPSLRHVSRSAPYMHNGLFPTLRGLVNLYNAGGAIQPHQPERAARDPLFGPATEVSPHLRPLNLTLDERAALVAFLEAL
ncbi:cytochrome-c peroxidase [Pseudodonghicola flavimaris]|uniref:Cytochrome c peroxidase n=1 Tax=Pseudodonghicola flavimaris TaxID=3050036 RepID=A0ABT7F698_9RHOB|nr:cytochrome c peroxidase [Pseudodonghicola flavimaris]MDK3020134.1 cytochrome c peroxidase [Pseudodonghicola flavimaris]